MNDLVQTILVSLAVILALLFIVKKFVWSPKRKKATKDCDHDGCGC